MRAVDIIRKKRDGGVLSGSEIEWMVQGLMSGAVADYQWSALLMGVLWRGMTESETSALTLAMMNSGSIVDLSGVHGRKVDKHSTGGVGDKTSFILAPVAAAAGVRVPMVSGRGLGHTGGTLDKLESIPGMRVDLDVRRYEAILEECGLVMIGQTAEIAPADRKLYALRDATATVEAIPLLASSIMSKKLAEGIDGLVLDVKTGNGAFMPDLDDSRKLAVTMCEIGRDLGKDVCALITRMDQPLGLTVGNALEIVECVQSLKGQGPKDLVDLSIELAAEMVLMARLELDIDAARARCLATIANGSAFERFRRLVELQGGDPRAIDDLDRLPVARSQIEILAASSGYLARMEARPIGHATMLLGAGREKVDSSVDHAVGIVFRKKVGDPVEEGEPIGVIHVNDPSRVKQAVEIIEAAIGIEEHAPKPVDLIVERL